MVKGRDGKVKSYTIFGRRRGSQSPTSDQEVIISSNTSRTDSVSVRPWYGGGCIVKETVNGLSQKLTRQHLRPFYDVHKSLRGQTTSIEVGKVHRKSTSE